MTAADTLQWLIIDTEDGDRIMDDRPGTHKIAQQWAADYEANDSERLEDWCPPRGTPRPATPVTEPYDADEAQVEVQANIMEFYDMINEGSKRNGPIQRQEYEYTIERALLALRVAGWRLVRSPK